MMQRGMNSIPFPVTPFNTPAQGTSVFMGPDLRNFFLSGSNNHHQHLNSVSNPTLSVSIKEEITDLETDLETMKVRMFLFYLANCLLLIAYIYQFQ